MRPRRAIEGTRAILDLEVRIAAECGRQPGLGDRVGMQDENFDSIVWIHVPSKWRADLRVVQCLSTWTLMSRLIGDMVDSLPGLSVAHPRFIRSDMTAQ